MANGDTIPLRYAENLTLVSYPAIPLPPAQSLGYVAHATYLYTGPERPRTPGTSSGGTVVRTPLSKSVIYSSVHCGLMDNLDLRSIGGVCDLKYIKLPTVHEVYLPPGHHRRLWRRYESRYGAHHRPASDAILLSPFENSGGYGRIEKLDIPIIECADYMETSALGRAEWMRFYGLLFGVAPQADNLFAEVDSCYQRLKMRAQLSSTSFSVVSELKSGSAWYVPGGRSTIGRLFRMLAGVTLCRRYPAALFLWLSRPFSDKAGDADVWLVKYNRDRDMSYADLEADYIGHTGFKAFKTRNVYSCKPAKFLSREAPFRPDYLLSDLMQILHPEIEIWEACAILQTEGVMNTEIRNFVKVIENSCLRVSVC